jgi:hypothetical protein
MYEPIIKSSPSARFMRLDYYLKKVINPDAKAAIAKKLKMIFSMHAEFDTDPVDHYRYLGVQTIRLQLIKEVNKMIMDHIGRSTFLLPWARELYEFKALCEDLIKNTEEMLRSLIAHGIYDGFYVPEDTGLKPTTPAGAGGSNEGSTVEPISLFPEEAL